MEEKIVTILNEMAEYLTVPQMKKLQEVILRTFSENELEKQQISNEEFLEMFLDAKRVEGCSERTIQYYKVTAEHMLSQTEKEIRKITTDEMRSYLADYQKRNNCSNVTIDNIRRNISSFFTWLEEEDYILKSPMRRIHKIKTKTVVKSVITDEGIEQLRDHCTQIRDLAMIDLLYSTGIRVGELVNLNIGDINFEERECVVYGKGDKAVKAKSVTAEEINRITGYNADIANFKDVSIPSCQYNNEVTYTLESGGISCIGTKYPTASVKSTGVSSFTYLSGNQWKNLNQGEKIKIKNTVYGYFADTLTNNEDDEIKGIKTTSNAYKLLFNNRNDGIYNKKDPTPRGSGYWIATTGTWTDTDTARYGLFVASYGIGVNTLYFSNNEKKPSFPQSQCIRPVVTLESDIQLIDSQKTKDGCKIWNIR